MNRPKSINALMAYMRDNKGIQINGSTQKKKLRYMGYFHGYKGYRYHGTPNNIFAFQSFNELQAVYNFDMSLKAMLYPQIMFLETAIKNYVLEVIIECTNSKRFAEIYSKLLTDYKAHPVGSNKYKNAIIKRMSVRNKIYNIISRDYGKRYIVNHYYDKDQPLPIWAIFELLTLGEFGNFISCLNITARKKISKSVGIKTSVDGDGQLLTIMVYVLKDLRNAVAHNNTIFDTRFKTGYINTRIANYISAETGISNLTFNTITDYIILIAFFMKLLQCSRTDIMSFINKFEQTCEIFRKTVSTQIYTSVVYTDTRKKLALLKNYL